ncbi:uncharacterized protein DEA37_0010840 [Paragonimus westermani]|uniref:Poly(A) RNA polymerase mitochondrial-like central palm domain-containing protein n=1 Tax=Paragonimus westermani TaxID=34504 RepID=A0A5J4NUB6_9TREM|nr:uncharacterized protein DEA37_0010840 [Paragonimus westermani]
MSCEQSTQLSTKLPSLGLILAALLFFTSSTYSHYFRNRVQLIREFRKKLFRFNNTLRIVHLRPILHAKVPILKVRFENGLEADISFSNYLALINTRMLKFYTKVEPWLRTLGIALKIVGKLCHIANASTGGVSSYALIIMLIHYLQQKNHLPVLQQLHDGSETPVNLISGWNAWFQDDLSVVVRCVHFVFTTCTLTGSFVMHNFRML